MGSRRDCKIKSSEFSNLKEEFMEAKTKTLIFQDKKIEAIYRTSLSSFQILSLKLLLLLNAILSFLHLIEAIQNEENEVVFRRIFPQSINLLVMLFCSIVAFRKGKIIKNPQILLIILQIYLGVVYTEIHKRNWQLTRGIQPYFQDMEAEFIMLLPLISKCHWRVLCSSTTGISVYFIFRHAQFSIENLKLTWFTNLFCALNLVFLGLISYKFEKHDRQQFYLSRKSETSQKHFQHMVKRVLPSAIMIFAKGKVLFYNQEMCRLLDIQFETRVEDKLSKIIIVEKPVENEFKEKEPSQHIFQRMRHSSRVEPVSLIDFLKRECGEDRFSCGFESFSGVYKDETANELNRDDEKKILSIKVCNLNWDDHESLLIVMNEDLITQKINHLEEQASYKDKMIATVSHDLRTPLNGMIGILEMAIDEEQDATIRKRFTKPKIYPV